MELVRHRVASYAQESTRYCNYTKDKFGNRLTYIIPSWIDVPEGIYEISEDNKAWVVNGRKLQLKQEDKLKINLILSHLYQTESYYLAFTKKGHSFKNFDLSDTQFNPEQTRSLLPFCIKTELCMKCNLREWRHFFNLRCSQAAHPDIRVLALDLLKQFHERIPIIFDDLYDKYVK